MTIKRIALLATLAAAALPLAACGDKEAPAPETNVGELTPVETTPEPEIEPTPAPILENTTIAEPAPAPEPAPDLTPDEQTQEYAEATGMTARVSRDNEGNDTAEVAE
jgi:hypothetical protein